VDETNDFSVELICLEDRHMRGGDESLGQDFYGGGSPIHHPLKGETAGGGVHAALASVFGLKHIRDLVGLPLAFSDRHQGADNASTHFVEEAISLQGDHHVTGSMSDTAPKEGAYGGFIGVVAI